MPRVCEFTGKKTSVGYSYQLRGKAKYLGGVGTKITAKTKRTFKPNIQIVTTVTEDGSVKRVKACTRAIKSGLITKPVKRAAWRRKQAQQG